MCDTTVRVKPRLVSHNNCILLKHRHTLEQDFSPFIFLFSNFPSVNPIQLHKAGSVGVPL